MGHLNEQGRQRGQPDEPADHESQAGGPRVVGVKNQQHRRDYRYGRKCDYERERYQLAEQRPGGLARSGARGRVPAVQQVGQPAEIDEHVIALSLGGLGE